MWLPTWLLIVTATVGPISSEHRSVVSRTRRDAGEKRVVCYYTNWSVYRPGTAKFNPQNINPYLCTHLIYAFGGLSKENSLKAFDKYQDIEQGGYAKFNGLKTYNKNLKTMVAIGGWNEGSARFSPLVADAERRKELVRNVIKFLRQNHFDGLDLDWEYPAFRDGGKARDRDNYAKFVQELREEFDRESSKTGRTRLLLTMAVPAGIEYIDKGYDVPKLNEYLDWFNILSYDYHSAFEPAVDHHAPLLPLEPDDEYNFGSQLNIDATVKHYLELGADRNKLVLGIPTYGRSYTLFNPDATDIGSPADGPGEQGDATREKGYLAYYEICEKVKNEGWTVVNSNPEAMGPYAYKDNQWVGYDDEAIVRAKSKYVNENDLGGIMFWSIDNDDFRGKCHGKPYPLIEAAKEALLASSNELAPNERERERERERPERPSGGDKKKSESSSKPKNRKSRPKPKTTTEASRTTRTTPAYSTTTPQPPTTPDPGSDFVCKDEGFFPHPRDCKKYFWCLDSGPSSLGIVAHQFTCPSGLVFNKISDSCDYPRNVICKNKVETTTTTTSATPTTTTAKTTTSRSRLVITAAPPRHRTTTTTTTTEEPAEYEEYEDEEEDPGTIKELIGLIKRLGGVEQLEKQLTAQEGSKAAIKPSLFSKVLSGRTGNKFRGGAQEDTSTARYQSLFRNRPSAPQSSGLELENEPTSTRQEKPQYTTIQRNRGPNRKPVETETKEDEDEDEEEPEEPKNSRRRPSGATEKEYVSLKRNNARNGDGQTTPKYKSILRTRSTTEAPSEEESEEEEEEEDEARKADRVTIADKPKKYSAVYRESNKPRYDDDQVEEKEKVSAVRPQYVTLTRERVTKPSEPEDEPTSSSAPVNIVNNVKYVELRRRRPAEPDTTTTESVNIVNIPNYAEIPETSSTSTEAVASSTASDVASSPNTPQYAVIRRKQEPTTEEPVPDIPSTDSIVSSSTEPVTSSKYQSIQRGSSGSPNEEENEDDEKVNFVQRRNDGVTEGIRRRTRPPVLTTQSITDAPPTTRTRFRSSSQPPALSVETPNRFRIRTNPENVRRIARPTFSTSTPPSEPISDPPRRFQFAPRTKPTLSTPVVKNETTFTIIVPETTVFQTEWTTLPYADTEATSEESSEKSNSLPTTAFQKLRTTTTPRPAPTTSTVTRVVTSITESSFTERQKIMVTKKPTFVKRITKPTTEKTVSDTTKSSLRATRPYNGRRVERTTTITTPTTTERPRGRVPNSRFRPRSTTLAPVETSTEERKFVPKRGRARGFTKFDQSVEVTTPTVSATTQKVESSFRRRVVARRLKRPKEDLDTQQSGSFYEDDDELDNKFILGESIKKTSGRDYLSADVLFATVPSVETEEKSAIRENISQENDKSTVRPTSPVFRGRKKADESIIESVPENYRKKIQRVVQRRRPVVRAKFEEVSSVTDGANVPQVAEDVALETGPEPERKRPETQLSSTTQGPPRRGSQEYLTNLRSRSRSTTSTSTTTTERPQRRPGVNLDRRRKFRPERISSSTARPDNLSDSSITSPRSASIGRRTRPTTSTTTTTTTTEQAFEESVEEREIESDLPDLADPAVVAIHNLATLAPVPIRESPSPFSASPFTAPPRPSAPSFRDSTALNASPLPAFPESSPVIASPRPFQEAGTFTASPRPFQESSLFSNSPRPTPPTYRDASLFTSPPRFSTTAFRETTSSLRPSTRVSVATSYSDFRQNSGQPPALTTKLFSPSTTDRGVTLEAVDTPSTRSEVVIAPRRQTTTTTQPPPPPQRAPTQRKLKPFSKVPKQTRVQTVTKPEKFSSKDYEYYDDADSLADVPASALKVKVHSDGYIECLDQGNFPHPFSCKKFISCAKMENTDLLGWEYTCPKHLSFDPVGGICNWSAGLGCQH